MAGKSETSRRGSVACTGLFSSSLSRVLADLPAVRSEIFLAGCDRLRLERRSHGVVPAVEEAEVRDHRGDLDDLILRPMLVHLGEHLVGYVVRDGGRGERE